MSWKFISSRETDKKSSLYAKRDKMESCKNQLKAENAVKWEETIIQWLGNSYKLILIGSINNYFKCDGLKYRDCQNEFWKEK